MTLSQIVGAVAWDPQIRGVLSVVAMVVILMGSVYLLLATNLATRLGFLIAVTGLFGWMTLIGAVWWVYAQGWVGDDPQWEAIEVTQGDLAGAELEEARELSGIEGDLPDAADLDELPEEEFEGVAEDLEDNLAGWGLLPESHGDRGESQPTYENALTADPNTSVFANTDEYVVLYGLDYGGKPTRESDGVVDRVTNRISNTLRLTNPPRYLLIMVQPGEPEQEPVPGEPPPAIVPVEGAEPVSVIMERDLGNRRLPAAMTTIVSGVLFFTCSYMLHVRDKTLEANRAAPLPEPAAGAEPVGVGNGS